MSGDEEDVSKHGAWTPEEDKLLACYQKQYGNRWSVVAQHIPGRTGQQCAQRWRHKVNPHIRKEKWTAEEDRTLAALVAEHGNKWADIAKHIPGRTDQQCMGRWRRHLDPNIRKCSWLAREDEVLKSKYQEIGSQWSNISKFLAGRTAQQCRARWFQICPQEAQEVVAQRESQNGAPCTTHKRERHYDGNSIKASARQLLAQMARDSGSKSAARPGRGAARRGGAAPPKGRTPAASNSSAPEDEACWATFPATTQKAPNRGKPIAEPPELADEDSAPSDEDSDKQHGALRTRSARGLPCQSVASPTTRRSAKTKGAASGKLPALPPSFKLQDQSTGGKSIGAPGTAARMASMALPGADAAAGGCSELEACFGFEWKKKKARSSKAANSSGTRRARTPSPGRRNRDDSRKDLVFFTPQTSHDRALAANAEPADIEAADILTELSGSFHLNASRASPASVRQAPLNLLGTPAQRSPASTIPHSRGGHLNWGDSRTFTSPHKGGMAALSGLEDVDIAALGTPTALHSRVFDPMGLSPMPHDLLMTPSSRSMLNKMAIEPLDKSIDLSLGFTPHSGHPRSCARTLPGTPRSHTTSVKRRQEASAASTDDSLDKRTAARRLQFCAGADSSDAKHSGDMPPPPDRVLESPAKKRRVDGARSDADVKLEPDLDLEPNTALPVPSAAHVTTSAAMLPPSQSSQAQGRATVELSTARDSGAPAVVQTPAGAHPRELDSCRTDAFLHHDLSTLPPANKENRLQGNMRAVDDMCGQGSGTSSTDIVDVHLMRSHDSCDDVMDTVVVDASSCQIKSHLENLLDDVFG